MTITLTSRPDRRGIIAQWSLGGNIYCNTFASMKTAKEYFHKWENVTFDDRRTRT